MRKRVFELDNQVYKLIGDVIRYALNDLYGKNKYHKATAMLFFKESELFRLTGLKLENLKQQYEKRLK